MSGRRRMPRPADAAWCWAEESADCHIAEPCLRGSSLSMTSPASYDTNVTAPRGAESSAGRQSDARDAALGDTDPASGRVAGACRPLAARGSGQSVRDLHGSHRAHRRRDRPQLEPHERLLGRRGGGTLLRPAGARSRDRSTSSACIAMPLARWRPSSTTKTVPCASTPPWARSPHGSPNGRRAS